MNRYFESTDLWMEHQARKNKRRKKFDKPKDIFGKRQKNKKHKRLNQDFEDGTY